MDHGSFSKRFEREGFRVSVKDHSTLVELNGQPVPVVIREGLKQVPIPPEQRNCSWQKMLYRPNGTLHLEIVHCYSPDRLCSDSARWRSFLRSGAVHEPLRPGGISMVKPHRRVKRPELRISSCMFMPVTVHLAR